MIALMVTFRAFSFFDFLAELTIIYLRRYIVRTTDSALNKQQMNTQFLIHVLMTEIFTGILNMSFQICLHLNYSDNNNKFSVGE
jgi:hypothetical protein